MKFTTKYSTVSEWFPGMTTCVHSCQVLGEFWKLTEHRCCPQRAQGLAEEIQMKGKYEEVSMSNIRWVTIKTPGVAMKARKI